MAVVGLTAYVNAQGTFIIDSSANGGDGATTTSTSGGLVFINGVLDTATDINLSVLWGTSSSSVTSVLNIDPGALNGGNNSSYTGNPNWIATESTGANDISFNGNGTISDFNGNSYITAVAAGSPIFLIIQGWTGSYASYAAASAAQGATFGQTGVFSLTVAASTAPIQPDVHSMGSLDLVTTSVPEPTSLALAGLGGFGMLMALRRKQA